MWEQLAGGLARKDSGCAISSTSLRRTRVTSWRSSDLAQRAEHSGPVHPLEKVGAHDGASPPTLASGTRLIFHREGGCSFSPHKGHPLTCPCGLRLFGLSLLWVILRCYLFFKNRAQGGLHDSGARVLDRKAQSILFLIRHSGETSVTKRRINEDINQGQGSLYGCPHESEDPALPF